MRPKQPMTVGRAAMAVLAFPFKILKTTLVVTMVALAHAFGGRAYRPKPEPKNLPCEVRKD